MTALEQQIINLLPTLSVKAKNEARLILGVKTSKPKANKGISIEEARVGINKFLKLQKQKNY
jgi:hypothetical protein